MKLLNDLFLTDYGLMSFVVIAVVAITMTCLAFVAMGLINRK
jgi:hypothetical protein